MTVDEDHQLIQRCVRGDIEQFRGLVEKYQQKIYLIIYGIVLQREVARDLTQETFIKAYRALSRFRGRSKVYTWLYRIALNLALDEKRKSYRRMETIYDDTQSWPGLGRRPTLRPDQETLRSELHEIIIKGLEHLTPAQRTALVLREWEGLSYQEISKVMKCSLGTVMSRLHYARDKLADWVKKYLI